MPLKDRLWAEALDRPGEHEQVGAAVRRVVRHDLVGRHEHPFAIDPCVPTILRMVPLSGGWADGGLDLELGLDRVTGIAARLRILIAVAVQVIVGALQVAQIVAVRARGPIAFLGVGMIIVLIPR